MSEWMRGRAKESEKKRMSKCEISKLVSKWKRVGEWEGEWVNVEMRK